MKVNEIGELEFIWGITKGGSKIISKGTKKENGPMPSKDLNIEMQREKEP